MTRYLIGIVLLILFGYGCLEAWPLVAGPSISLVSPTQNETALGGMVTVAGDAPRAASLTLDGAPLLRDKLGHFSSTLTFPHGGSILTLVATDRFGRSVSVTRSIFVPQS